MHRPVETPSPVVVARGAGATGGEVALRRRGTGPLAVIELVVNGVFAMDTEDVSTERALAARTLELLPEPGPTGWRVVVGGLGVGATADQVLSDDRVTSLTVVELEPLLVEWLRAGLVPAANPVMADPRLDVRVGDVLDVVPTLAAGSVDAVLLDVDNGPGFLVHDQNAAVYGGIFLAQALATLRRGGVLAVWSADPAPHLAARLRALAGQCRELRLPVHRSGRDLEYSLYLASSGACASATMEP